MIALIKGLQLLLSLSILVVLHELGHYLAARYFKTRVEKFYLFMNPGFSLFKKQIGETEWGIGWLPLGGYVKMLESSEINDDTDKSDYLYCFDKQSVYKKFLIVAAGPAFNLILAIIFFTIVHFSGITGGQRIMEICLMGMIKVEIPFQFMALALKLETIDLMILLLLIIDLS